MLCAQAREHNNRIAELEKLHAEEEAGTQSHHINSTRFGTLACFGPIVTVALP